MLPGASFLFSVCVSVSICFRGQLTLVTARRTFGKVASGEQPAFVYLLINASALLPNLLTNKINVWKKTDFIDWDIAIKVVCVVAERVLNKI